MRIYIYKSERNDKVYEILCVGVKFAVIEDGINLVEKSTECGAHFIIQGLMLRTVKEAQ